MQRINESECTMAYEQLKLENQLCFPVYAASRLITRAYQPMLDGLGITYPQYLVMMILWEHRSMPVNDIAKKLILNTNTVTPLLKRMEQQGLVLRSKSEKDERKVLVQLTQKGKEMQEQAALIPEKLVQQLLQTSVRADELIHLKKQLDALVKVLSEKD